MEATLTLTLKDDKGRTIPAGSSTQAPLTYSWIPGGRHAPAVIHLVNQAGVTLGGDSFSSKINLEENAHAVVTTQSVTKVSRGTGDVAVEHLQVMVARGGVLEWISDPSVLFRGVQADHLTQLHLSSQSRLIWISGQMLGRIASDERLAFKMWRHKFDVAIDSKRELLEQWSLAPDVVKDELDVVLGHYSIMGLALFHAPEFNADFLSRLSDMAGTPNEELIVGFSSLKENLKVVRFLASNGEAFRRFSTAVWKTARRSISEADPPNLGKF